MRKSFAVISATVGRGAHVRGPSSGQTGLDDPDFAPDFAPDLAADLAGVDLDGVDWAEALTVSANVSVSADAGRRHRRRDVAKRAGDGLGTKGGS